MVNQCANPECGKPLHYLREGRVYVFDVTRYVSAPAEKARRMEHFWLCGACSDIYLLEQTAKEGVRVSRRQAPASVAPYVHPHSIAS